MGVVGALGDELDEDSSDYADVFRNYFSRITKDPEELDYLVGAALGFFSSSKGDLRTRIAAAACASVRKIQLVGEVLSETENYHDLLIASAKTPSEESLIDILEEEWGSRVGTRELKYDLSSKSALMAYRDPLQHEELIANAMPDLFDSLGMELSGLGNGLIRRIGKKASEIFEGQAYEEGEMDVYLASALIDAVCLEVEGANTDALIPVAARIFCVPEKKLAVRVAKAPPVEDGGSVKNLTLSPDLACQLASAVGLDIDESSVFRKATSYFESGEKKRRGPKGERLYAVSLGHAILESTPGGIDSASKMAGALSEVFGVDKTYLYQALRNKLSKNSTKPSKNTLKKKKLSFEQVARPEPASAIKPPTIHQKISSLTCEETLCIFGGRGKDVFSAASDFPLDFGGYEFVYDRIYESLIHHFESLFVSEYGSYTEAQKTSFLREAFNNPDLSENFCHEITPETVLEKERAKTIELARTDFLELVEVFYVLYDRGLDGVERSEMEEGLSKSFYGMTLEQLARKFPSNRSSQDSRKIDEYARKKGTVRWSVIRKAPHLLMDVNMMTSTRSGENSGMFHYHYSLARDYSELIESHIRHLRERIAQEVEYEEKIDFVCPLADCHKHALDWADAQEVEFMCPEHGLKLRYVKSSYCPEPTCGHYGNDGDFCPEHGLEIRPLPEVLELRRKRKALELLDSLHSK